MSPKVRTIIAETAARWEITPEDILGRSREQIVVRARREALWRCRQEIDFAGASVQWIARQFGLHHTSVLSALKIQDEHVAEHGWEPPPPLKPSIAPDVADLL